MKTFTLKKNPSVAIPIIASLGGFHSPLESTPLSNGKKNKHPKRDLERQVGNEHGACICSLKPQGGFVSCSIKLGLRIGPTG